MSGPEHVKFGPNGVVEGSYICNVAESDVLNKRLFERNLPSAPLQPQFSMRGASTRYSIMPIVDPRPASQLVPVKRYPTYNPATTFNPGDAQAPWSGFATNIDVLSKLRNQGQALQHCDQRDYIPSSESDMYESIIPVTQDQQTHKLLFQADKFAQTNHAIYGMGGSVFQNHTRQDLKNATSICSGHEAKDLVKAHSENN